MNKLSTLFRAGVLGTLATLMALAPVAAYGAPEDATSASEQKYRFVETGGQRGTGGIARAPLAGTAVSKDVFIPAVRLVGATGTFRTDAWIFNPDPDRSARVSLYFTPERSNGSNSPEYRINPDLFPRESVSIRDVISTIFRLDNTFGVVEIRSDLPIMVTSNTYNAAGANGGTFGQFIPALPYADSIGFDDSLNGNLYLIGLPNDANHRTNAVLINTESVELEAGVQLVDASGQILGTKTYRVAPFSMLQLNDIFGAEFSAFRPATGTHRLTTFVNLNNGARILSYATVSDLRTFDPYLIVGQTQRP